MRRILTVIFVGFTMMVCAQTAKKKVVYKNAKTFVTDLNNDGKPDTIVISSSLTGKDCFNRISVSLSGFKKQTFRAKDSWTNVDKWFLDSNKNSIDTKLIFLKKTDKHAVIVLFGVLYGAGERGEFSIINIENNNIKMVFDHNDDDIDVETPITLRDIENNGRLCFIYNQIGEYQSYIDKYHDAIGTYTPFFVYPVRDTCKMDKALTKKYNEDHYVFAGYDYSNKIKILYPRSGGKPSIYKK